MDTELKATAPQVACWSSALRAMLWKEWRQQWLPFVLLAGLAPLIMLVGGHWSPFVAAGSATLVVWVGIPLILGANAFAGEHDQGTDALLHALPASAGWFFRAKFLAVGGLSLVGFLPVLLLSPLLPSCPDKLWLDQPGFWLRIGVLASVFVISTVAAVASFRGRVLATLLVAMVLAAVGAAWLGFCAVFLICFPPWRYGAACLMVLFGTGLALAIAGWLASRPKETLGAVRGVIAAAGYAVLVAVPPAISYLYVLFVIAPADYGDYPEPDDLRPVSVWISRVVPGSASHHHVALQCEQGQNEFPVSGFLSSSARVAFLDTETGKWFWFDRYRRSHIVSWNDPWSPDGSKCLVGRSSLWIWPLDLLTPEAPFEIDLERRWESETAWVFRADEGTSSQLPDLLPDGWLDNEWVFSRRDSDPGRPWTGLSFYNVRTGERSVCRSSSPPEWRLMPADAGVFGMRVAASVPGVKDCGTRVIVQRYHPKLERAEETVLSHSWTHPCLLNLSPNGRWLLAGEERDFRRGIYCPRAYFVRPDRGIVRDLAPPPGLAPIRSPVFVPGAERAVVLLTDGAAVYDLDTDQWRSFHLPVPLPGLGGSAPTCHDLFGWIEGAPDGRHAILWISGMTAFALTRTINATVIDLDDGRNWPLGTPNGRLSERDVTWLTDKALLFRLGNLMWLADRDGMRTRWLLPRQAEGAP